MVEENLFKLASTQMQLLFEEMVNWQDIIYRTGGIILHTLKGTVARCKCKMLLFVVLL